MNVRAEVGTVTERVPVLEKIGYGLGDMAANFIWRNMMTFLGFFYTDVFGLKPAAVATLFLVSRVTDGFVDVVIGTLADRTDTRWGKFRPWILFSIIPLAGLLILTFYTPQGLGYNGKLIYAYLTYISLLIAYTANNIPYGALNGVISADPIERKSISSYRFFFAFSGGLVVYALTLYLVPFFGGTTDGVVNNQKGYFWTMITFGVIAAILWIITFVTTKERIKPISHIQSSLKNDLKDLVANMPWVILFLVGLLYCTMTGVKQGVTLYYFKYFISETQLFGRTFDSDDLAVLFMVTGALSAMVGSMLTPSFIKNFGTNKTMVFCIVTALISSAALYFMAPSQIILIILLSMVFEFVGGPIITLFFAMLADAADYSEWKTNRRATGLIFSAGSVATKFGPGVAGWLVGIILALYAYEANNVSAEAVGAIKMMISLIPAGIAALLLGAFLLYPLTDAKLQQIKNDLQARRAEG